MSPAKARLRAKVAQALKVAAPARPAAAPVAEAFFLKLDPCCTLRESADLQFSLVAANGDPVVVDGSAVERVDTAGLQLLVALAQRQQQSGRRLEWKAASPEIIKCGERLGLIGALGLGTSGNGGTP
jgi:phospholipid transport system transporter-binding protein